ncbi:LysR family transcriptional regulator [Clostridium carboxidivorans P7]|uniref:Transcriptional regulator, LysR family n=1 Tax=Clostridium carboxidivorans P7 TaxID=536227 RepID=C6PMZ8_9CLOT|nr:LysR family transcriptional regulator [Clostridium carboxidivorans]AKN30895.1 LysR family transcriptional regulator [Clostridium carboxidivorans P7]EET89331.1 transcriptional regulator, LysR family [Clostridium carboxidivorans P7]EFG88857.1 transcriptional regulator, LysR family [Clostridium carboxidivorans P7]
MDIKQLKYFLQVCKHKSFSKAAKEIYITQQGLSKAINNLEEELQYPLFYNTSKGIRITKYGEYLQKQSEHIVQEFDLILEGLNKMDNINEGTLTVCFSFGVLNALSPDIISDFKEAYPKVQLIVKTYPDSICEEVVMNENVDLAVSIGPVNEKNFNSTVIKSQHPCILVNEKNSLCKKTAVDFSDLENENLIVLNEKFHFHRNFINKCKEAGFEPNIVFTTSEIIGIHKLSHFNKGIGVSVDFMARDINYPDVHPIPFKDESFVWEICLITKKDRFQSNLVKIFTKHMLNH